MLADSGFVWKRFTIWLQWKLLDNVWSITLLALLLFAIYLAIRWNELPALLSSPMAFAAAVATTLAFLHKHSLEADKMSLEIFNRYNSAFKNISSEIGSIHGKLAADATAQVSQLSPEDKEILSGYIDICAEEYFLFLNGRVHPRIWKTWSLGMLRYLGEKPFCDHEELNRPALYYGMTINRVRELAPKVTNAQSRT